MNENEVKIDYHGLLNQIADKVIVDFMSSLLPDEKTRKFMVDMVTIHRKYGIDAATSIKIIQEMGEMMMRQQEEEKK